MRTYKSQYKVIKIGIKNRVNIYADTIRSTLKELGYGFMVENSTNQLFPILPDAFLNELAKNFMFIDMERIDENHRAVRFCTSWATTEENVDKLCAALREYGKL